MADGGTEANLPAFAAARCHANEIVDGDIDAELHPGSFSPSRLYVYGVH